MSMLKPLQPQKSKQRTITGEEYVKRKLPKLFDPNFKKISTEERMAELKRIRESQRKPIESPKVESKLN